MKLSRTASYAFHAVAYMAAQKENEPVASHLIAAARGIPTRFLLKVLKPLVDARLLVSVKGPNGGYRLARPIEKISVLDVLDAVDRGLVRGEAPLHDNANLVFHARLEQLCKQSADQTRRHLQAVMLSELLPTRK